MPDRSRCSRRLARAAAFAVCVATLGVALADVDLGIGRGDSVKGTFDAGAEQEVFRVTVPSGAKLTAKITGSKGAKGHLNLTTADGTPLAASSPAKPTSPSETLVHTTSASGVYRVITSSREATVGSYALSVKWTTPARRAGTVSLDGGPQQVFLFGADEGATATVSAKAAAGSAALPRIVRIDGPAGFAAPIGVGGTAPSAKAPATRLGAAGDYAVLLENGGAPGDVEVTVTVKAPKRKPRKVDVTTAALGGAGTAVGEVVGAQGAVIAVGDLGLGGGLTDISGAQIAIPAGAVPSGTPIFIGNSPPLDPKGAPAPIGAPVSFGPDGQKFATPVTITLPVSNTNVPEADIAVFTRSGSGKVTQVDAPLDIDLGSGTVSFPASHFSDYVVVTTHEPPENPQNFFTLAAGLGTPSDATIAPLDSTPNSLYLLASGQTVRVVTFTPPTTYGTSLYAGGGAQTADGTNRLAFDFGGAVNAVYVDGDSVYVATDTAVYVVDDASGAVTRVFGTGVAGDSGDTGPGVAAQIAECVDVEIGPSGTILLVDKTSGRIRTLDSGGIAGSLAGNGSSGFGADDPDALATSLDAPAGVAHDFLNSAYYLAERTRLRRVNVNGSLQTIAGIANASGGCLDPISSPLTAAFTRLSSVSAFVDGQTVTTKVYFTDEVCHTIWFYDPAADTVRRVAGTLGVSGVTSDFDGVGLVSSPRAILGITSEFFIFLDSGNGKLRQFTTTQ